jgi:hypothetical protein
MTFPNTSGPFQPPPRQERPKHSGPEPRHARVAATALVRTLAPVPARPAAAGGDAVSARATPGSMRLTPLDWPWARPGAAGVSVSIPVLTVSGRVSCIASDVLDGPSACEAVDDVATDATG